MDSELPNNNSTYHKRNTQGYTALLIWCVPKKLKRLFKMECAKRGTTMKDVVLGAIREFVRKWDV